VLVIALPLLLLSFVLNVICIDAVVRAHDPSGCHASVLVSALGCNVCE
jgi:hypothetical protein